MKKDTITMVCTGNTCRSPMAAKLLEHILQAEEEPLKSLKVGSAGISAGDGMSASKNSIKALAKASISLDSHKSSMLTDEIMDRSFAVFCMTSDHLEVAESYFSNEHEHLYLLREFIPEDHAPEIPDPIGQSLDAYEACRDAMIDALPSILKFLRENYK